MHRSFSKRDDTNKAPLPAWWQFSAFCIVYAFVHMFHTFGPVLCFTYTAFFRAISLICIVIGVLPGSPVARQGRNRRARCACLRVPPPAVLASIV